jgi:hypothetical protein
MSNKRSGRIEKAVAVALWSALWLGVSLAFFLSI